LPFCTLNGINYIFLDLGVFNMRWKCEPKYDPTPTLLLNPMVILV